METIRINFRVSGLTGNGYENKHTAIAHLVSIQFSTLFRTYSTSVRYAAKLVIKWLVAKEKDK